VRGKRSSCRHLTDPSRSIPACAGETRHCLPSTYSAGVYPRVCGGNCQMPAVRPYIRGLSPRVRGKPYQTGSGSSESGSIPACAGETYLHHHLLHYHQVYPRVCGGNLTDSDFAAIQKGLSPRVRGKHILGFFVL